MAKKQPTRKTPDKQRGEASKLDNQPKPKAPTKIPVNESYHIAWKDDVTGEEKELTIEPKVPTIRLADGQAVATAGLLRLAKGENLTTEELATPLGTIDQTAAIARLEKLAKMGYNF